MARAAEHLKRVSLELGGKSANIVFADADLELAARSAPEAVYLNAGQNCCARSRILVQRDVLDRFVELFVQAAQKLRVGSPADEATDMGPLITAAQRERVATYVDGDIAWQGDAPSGRGFWFPPTLLGPMPNDRRQAREEIFGPVACVIPFTDEAEAVAIANDTPYGLSGSVWSRDGARALRIAQAVRVGVLSVNSHDSVRVGAPFGGYKASGFGRELGREALSAYSEVKSVFVSTG
jgi:betaine-aldehyde dehydrogenase